MVPAACAMCSTGSCGEPHSTTGAPRAAAGTRRPPGQGSWLVDCAGSRRRTRNAPTPAPSAGRPRTCNHSRPRRRQAGSASRTMCCARSWRGAGPGRARRGPEWGLRHTVPDRGGPSRFAPPSSAGHRRPPNCRWKPAPADPGCRPRNRRARVRDRRRWRRSRSGSDGPRHAARHAAAAHGSAHRRADTRWRPARPAAWRRCSAAISRARTNTRACLAAIRVASCR
ncbi:Uncharacterised protein [Bordetella pertussis]|nr:Uncharacterised protein [Bordetella pertussis]